MATFEKLIDFQHVVSRTDCCVYAQTPWLQQKGADCKKGTRKKKGFISQEIVEDI